MSSSRKSLSYIKNLFITTSYDGSLRLYHGENRGNKYFYSQICEIKIKIILFIILILLGLLINKVYLFIELVMEKLILILLLIKILLKMF